MAPSKCLTVAVRFKCIGGRLHKLSDVGLCIIGIIRLNVFFTIYNHSITRQSTEFCSIGPNYHIIGSNVLTFYAIRKDNGPNHS